MNVDDNFDASWEFNIDALAWREGKEKSHNDSIQRVYLWQRMSDHITNTAAECSAQYYSNTLMAISGYLNAIDRAPSGVPSNDQVTVIAGIWCAAFLPTLHNFRSKKLDEKNAAIHLYWIALRSQRSICMIKCYIISSARHLFCHSTPSRVFNFIFYWRSKVNRIHFMYLFEPINRMAKNLAKNWRTLSKKSEAITGVIKLKSLISNTFRKILFLSRMNFLEKQKENLIRNNLKLAFVRKAGKWYYNVITVFFFIWPNMPRFISMRLIAAMTYCNSPENWFGVVSSEHTY